MGYRIELHYIGVESAEIAKERVARRVSHGGHGISDNLIEKRYAESLENLKKILPLCDYAALHDNTETIRCISIYENHNFLYLSQDLPDWFQQLELVRKEPIHEPLNQKIQRIQGELSREVHSKETISKEDIGIKH